MKYEVLPAIFREKAALVVEDLIKSKEFTQMVQIDLSDGELFKGMRFIDLRTVLKKDIPSLDVHLMVKDPFEYLIKNPKVKRISTQIEAPVDIAKWLEEAKSLGYEAGLSIGPETSTEEIAPYLPSLDFVQFMTVVPGKQGQPFLPSVPGKIRNFREKHPEMPIQADGGINNTTIDSVLQAGVNRVVIGSAILRAEDPAQAYKNFERIVKEHARKSRKHS